MGTFEKVFANAVANGFTLGNEFGGVELSDDGFEDFITNGREDTLVIVLAKTLQYGISYLGKKSGKGRPYLVDLGQHFDIRPVKNSE